MQARSHDVALVGAGPVGLEIAVALKKAGIDYVHFDAGQVGQTIFNWPTQTRFFSSSERIALAGVALQTPDQAKCSREQYLAYLRGIVQMFGLKIRTYERVTTIAREGESFLITTNGMHGASHWHVNKLILATGGTACPRRLGIPGEEQANVHHGYSDPHPYFRRRVLIVGGRNSAVEAALRCYHAGADVAVSYRGGAFLAEHVKYWLYPEITGLIRAGKIAGRLGTIVTNISGTTVTLQDVQTGTVSERQTDFVLVLIGYHADMSLARMAGVHLEGDLELPQIDQRTMQTNVPGVFIAGTAIAGTQDQFRIFIENCHTHAVRIVAALQGRIATVIETPLLRPET